MSRNREPYYIQLELFAAFPDVLLESAADHLGLGTQQTRKYAKSMEQKGLVQTVAQKPLRFRASERPRGFFGIEAGD